LCSDATRSSKPVHRAVEGGARYPTPVSLLDGIIGHFSFTGIDAAAPSAENR
jgi:hypothetical protein